MVPEKVERGFMRAPFSNRILPQPAVGPEGISQPPKPLKCTILSLEHIARRGFTEKCQRH